MNWRLAGIAVVALVAYSSALGLISYYRGKSTGREEYHQEQVRKTHEIKRKHARVKREAPGDGDKQLAIKWLLARTRK